LEDALYGYEARPPAHACAALGSLPPFNCNQRTGTDLAGVSLRMRILRCDPVSWPQATLERAGSSGQRARSALQPRLSLGLLRRRQFHGGAAARTRASGAPENV